MRFSIAALRVAAAAAHAFPPHYFCTRFHEGKSCPAQAMDYAGHGYHFSAMCDLLWHSAHCPSIVDEWNRLPSESKPMSQLWFQTTLSNNPSCIAVLFDSIIACSQEQYDPASSPTLQEVI